MKEIKVIYYKYNIFLLNIKELIELSEESYSKILLKPDIVYIHVYDNEYEFGEFLLQNHKKIKNIKNEYKEIMQNILKARILMEKL
jgi:hypothetical protein